MSSPQRIQRKRTKGWKMPMGAVYVGRGTRWGNPFVIGEVAVTGSVSHPTETLVRNRAHAVQLYRRWLFHQDRSSDLVSLLEGKDLACWCPLDEPCHADYLLKIANAA